jgi:hypothetical protein
MNFQDYSDGFKVILIVVVTTLVAFSIAVATTYPSIECRETCEVLDADALLQVSDRVWCRDPVEWFWTRCAE